jgi:trehalose/maltose hydrolase-like predicted phosphorylase
MPFVGNGFVATHPIVGSEGGVHPAYIGRQLFMSGVYNGVSKPYSEWGTNRQQSHRAALQDWVTNVTAGDGSPGRIDWYSLDMQRAIITKSWTAYDATLHVEELHLAHQTRRNVLLHIVNATNHGSKKVALHLTQHPGSPCGAEFTGGSCPPPDVKLAPVSCGQHRCVNGSIMQKETQSSPLLVVAMASNLVEPTIWIAPGETHTVVLARAVSSTLDGGADPLAVALSALEGVMRCAVADVLGEHSRGWAGIWENGLEVEGDVELATAINGSLYQILSSVRADWPYGTSPGLTVTVTGTLTL